jgi:hypothetical protein
MGGSGGQSSGWAPASSTRGTVPYLSPRRRLTCIAGSQIVTSALIGPPWNTL